jgi:hypothetical protein
MKVLAVVLLLALAQLIPSCGDQGDEGSPPRGQVIGWVDEKRQSRAEVLPYLLVINNLEYGVPYEFWMTVSIGDLVKYDGKTWTIVRKARG